MTACFFFKPNLYSDYRSETNAGHLHVYKPQSAYKAPKWTLKPQLPAQCCSGWLRLRMPGQRQKKVSERCWYLPSTTRRQVTRNALDNSGDGALTMVPLCRELSGTGDHTRKTMEVKRTSWANYGRYRRVYILLVSTRWLILESSNMTQRVTRPVLLLVLLLWWVIRTQH